MKLIKTLQMKLYKGLAIFATRRRDYWYGKSFTYGKKYLNMLEVDWKLEPPDNNPFR